ncbi:uncharacterized protein IWZ02DRAFT_235064 [Phyllosticta citriasiana]|uniref:Apple domain-containing protein n=1 Tax=Phyllosticta citriasiana TaxID=595635 RepID=A0ABR1KPS4_9PEZI
MSNVCPKSACLLESLSILTMRFSIAVSLLASLVALVAGQKAATVDKTSGAAVEGDCGIVGFTKPIEGEAVTKNTPLEIKERLLPFRFDVLDCIASCKKQIGPENCKTILWSLKFAQCAMTSRTLDSAIVRDVRGDTLFYSPECSDQIKDPKNPLALVVQGQN